MRLSENIIIVFEPYAIISNAPKRDSKCPNQGTHSPEGRRKGTLNQHRVHPNSKTFNNIDHPQIPPDIPMKFHIRILAITYPETN